MAAAQCIRQIDMAKTTCWRSTQAWEADRKVIYSKWFCKRPGWSKYFRNYRSAGIFPQNHLYGLQGMVQKDKISSKRKALLIPEIRGDWLDFHLTGKKQTLVTTEVAKRLWMHNMWNLEAAEVHTGCHFPVRKLRFQSTSAHQNWTVED